MLQARGAWQGRRVAFGTAVAAPVGRHGFVVDLSAEPLGLRWARGAATLLSLGMGALLLSPGLAPLPADRAMPLERTEAREWAASGVGAATRGSPSGLRMVAGGTVEPIAAAPERARVDHYLTLAAGEPLRAALERVGASPAEAAAAAQRVREAGASPAAGAALTLTLGPRGAGGRTILALAYRAGLDRTVALRREGDALTIAVRTLAVDRSPRRISGVAGDSLYFALRAAGVAPGTVADYLRVIADHADIGGVGPGDRFDLVIAHRAAGERAEDGPLLYAGLERADGGKVQLMRWRSGGQERWMSAGDLAARSAVAGAIWPVEGRITSGFGSRMHPILRFLRPHNGIDFGAPSGTPIVAAADGTVTGAGWAGGYGRQVRIAHAGGLSTSYSHMSAISVAAGTVVRQGQLIGHVGSSGLSTGAHLHYEVRRGGVPVNPMGVRFGVAAPTVDPGEARAFRARMAQLLRLARGS